jgi:hypothetical protein
MGGIAGLSPTEAVERIHKKLQEYRLNEIPSIFVSFDQTGAFSMINHNITLKKLKHIGFDLNAINLMRSYLKNRYQKTYYNGSYSKFRKIGDNSTFQGTKMATLIYVIYVLDQPSIIHIDCKHTYVENDKCEQQLSINFVDDNNSAITANNWNEIVEKTEKYLKNQQKYHNNNVLLLNNDKTTIMINTKKKKHKKKRSKSKN